MLEFAYKSNICKRLATKNSSTSKKHLNLRKEEEKEQGKKKRREIKC